MRTIPLTQVKEAIVDDADYEVVAAHQWRALRTQQGKRYAVRTDPTNNGRLLYLHRVVMGLVVGDRRQVDHVNRDGLDCRRSNMRLATPSENTANRRLGPNCSGFRGVSRVGTRWRAVIGYRRKWLHLGCYEDPEEAAREYDKAARLAFGRFAVLNFPEAA